MDNFQSKLRKIYEEIPHQRFYHGSDKELSVGTFLTPRFETYEKNWQHTDFYHALEKYRPEHMLSHKESVFMSDNVDDVDLSGASTNYLFTVIPIGKVEKHDLNWSSEICMLISELGRSLESDEVKSASLNYWNGIPHPDESVWEYLAPKAKIVKVEDGIDEESKMKPLKSIDEMLAKLQEADWGKSLKFVSDQLALRSKDLADIADKVIWQGDNMDGRSARQARDIQQSIDELATRLRKELAGFSESKLQDATDYGPYEATDAQLKAEKEIEKQGFRFSNWIPAQDPDDGDHGIMVMSKRGITRFGKEYREIDLDGSVNENITSKEEVDEAKISMPQVIDQITRSLDELAQAEDPHSSVDALRDIISAVAGGLLKLGEKKSAAALSKIAMEIQPSEEPAVATSKESTSFTNI